MSSQLNKILKESNNNGIEIVNELVQKGITEINEYLILGVKKQEFQQVYEFLSDKYTVDIKEPYEVIGQTIDGDWLLEKDDKVMYIHKSLDKEMTEEFEITVKEFLSKLNSKELDSKWISN